MPHFHRRPSYHHRDRIYINRPIYDYPIYDYRPPVVITNPDPIIVKTEPKRNMLMILGVVLLIILIIIMLVK